MSRTSAYHLVGKHEHRFERELALAVVEEVLERGAEEVNHHYVVISLDAEPVDVGDADWQVIRDGLTSSLQYAVEFGLVEQLGVLGTHWFLQTN